MIKNGSTSPFGLSALLLRTNGSVPSVGGGSLSLALSADGSLPGRDRRFIRKFDWKAQGSNDFVA